MKRLTEKAFEKKKNKEKYYQEISEKLIIQEGTKWTRNESNALQQRCLRQQKRYKEKTEKSMFKTPC